MTAKNEKDGRTAEAEKETEKKRRRRKEEEGGGLSRECDWMRPLGCVVASLHLLVLHTCEAQLKRLEQPDAPADAALLRLAQSSPLLLPVGLSLSFDLSLAMAELFATVAGVASLIDVALRTCNVLYDSSRYLKDAPQLSQRLRRTIESVKSIFQNLNELLALYRQQQATNSLPDILPGAIECEVISIKAELDTLPALLLPNSSASNQVRTKVKWTLNRKKVIEVVQALDSRQITLILALHTFTQ